MARRKTGNQGALMASSALRVKGPARSTNGQVARGKGGKELSDAQKNAAMSRYNGAFGTSINNMGQLHAAIHGVRNEANLTARQRRVLTSLRNSFTSSS